MGTKNLLTGATSTVTGSTVNLANARVNQSNSEFTVDVFGSTSAGAGAATVAIEVTNDPVNSAWKTLGTVTLVLGTSVASDGFAGAGRWEYIRARVTALSGTGAAVSAVLGA